jgi:two-component system response regulator NreC
VLKEAGADELINAVRTAAKGGLYVSPRIGAMLATTPSGDPYGGLTARELDVLRRLALGHTNAEIGEQLYLSTRTVESHRAHIQQKLRLTTRSDLVRWVLDHGLLDEPERPVGRTAVAITDARVGIPADATSDRRRQSRVS